MQTAYLQAVATEPSLQKEVSPEIAMEPRAPSCKSLGTNSESLKTRILTRPTNRCLLGVKTILNRLLADQTNSGSTSATVFANSYLSLRMTFGSFKHLNERIERRSVVLKRTLSRNYGKLLRGNGAWPVRVVNIRQPSRGVCYEW